MAEIQIKELPVSFQGVGEVRGFLFTQKESSPHGYIYQVYDPDINLTWYEAFERKVNTRFNCVSYPKSNAFGDWAFTYKTYDRAQEKLKEYDSNKNESNG